MTTASPPALARMPTLDERALAAKHGDLATYAKSVHGYDIEPYQLAWAEALESMDRVCIVCPPDTYKSTTVQLIVERLIGHDPNVRILWLMNAGEQAEKRVMTIGQIVDTNPIYKRAFRIQRDDDAQWTKTVLYVKRDISTPDPTLMGCGFNGPYQGLHFDRIIIDDPTNQEDVRSPTTMDLQRTKLRGVILDRLVDGGKIVVILTRWGENDLVPLLRDLKFTIVTMPIMADYPWGPTISNRRFPLSKVETMREDKGPDLFDLTYMCSTKGTDAGAIQRKHIKYWPIDHAIPDSPMAIYIGVDPAASTKTRADYSSIATVGIDLRTRIMYLLDVWAGRLEFPDLIQEILKRSKRQAGLMGVGVETKGFQLSIVQYLKRHHNLPIRELPYRTRRQVLHKSIGIDNDKYGRALYLGALFAANRLYIPEKLPVVGGQTFEAELCSIPDSPHDDRMDATVFACALADAAMPRKHRVKLSAA